MSLNDDLQSTIEALVAQRLAIIQAGPRPTYQLHGQNVSWTDYLRYLDESITNVRKQLAELAPFEIVSRAV